MLHDEIEAKEVEIAMHQSDLSPIKYNSIGTLPDCLLNPDKYRSQNTELEMKFKSTSIGLIK